MASSAYHTEHASSSPYVVPALILEDSDTAASNLIGNLVACFHHRPATYAPRFFLADTFSVLSRKQMAFTPSEKQLPSVALSSHALVVVVRCEGIAFGLLTAPETLFSLPRLEAIALHSGWLLYQIEVAALAQHTLPPLTSELCLALERLSPRKREVLRLTVEGQSVAALAQRFQCEQSTIRSHYHSIFGILGVHTKEEAIAIGRAAQIHCRL